MREITTELYSVQELKQFFPEGYQRAIKQYAQTLNTDYILCDAMTTIGTCLYRFGYRIKVCQLDISKPLNWHNPHFYILPISVLQEEEDGNPLEKSGNELMKFFENEFEFSLNKYWKPTGSPYDERFTKVLREYYTSRTAENLRKVLENACLAVFQQAHSDYKAAREEEAFLKFCDENEAEFFHNGDIW